MKTRIANLLTIECNSYCIIVILYNPSIIPKKFFPQRLTPYSLINHVFGINNPHSITEEESTRTMSDVVKELDTEELIDYLQRRDLKLKDGHFKILRKEEISGRDFLKTTKDEFRSIGFALGPAKRLADFIDELHEQKLRTYSSYKTLDDLKDMLRKNKVNGEDITR